MRLSFLNRTITDTGQTWNLCGHRILHLGKRLQVVFDAVARSRYT